MLERAFGLLGCFGAMSGRVREQREATPRAAEAGVVAERAEDAHRLGRNLAEVVVRCMQLMPPCGALQPCVPLLLHVASSFRDLNRLVDRCRRCVDVSDRPARGREAAQCNGPALAKIGERERPVEQAPRRRHVVADVRAPAGRCEQRPGALGECDVGNAELGPIPGGLFEVVPDELVLGAARVEPRCETLMELGTQCFRDPAVRGVADERVAEAEAVLVLRAGQIESEESD